MYDENTEIIPEEIGDAKVLYYIKIEGHYQSTGNTKQIVNGVLMGPAYGLAICKYEDDDAYYLFGCDKSWQSVTDTWHESIEDAMKQGKFEYDVTKNNWRKK